MRQHLIAYGISLALHLVLLVVVPAALRPDNGPAMTTVVVELLEKPEGEAETTLQSTPSGEKEKPSPPGEASEAGAPKATRAAEKGRTAPKAAQVVAKRPPLKKNTEPLPLERVPDKKFDLAEDAEEVPDPILGKVTEATLKLNEGDKRYQGFLGAVRTAVNRQWQSREAMLAAQRSGKVTLGFTLLPSGGRAAKVSVVDSSDSTILDDEAMRAVRAAGFPPFPTHWKLEKIHLVAQFVYAFNSGE